MREETCRKNFPRQTDLLAIKCNYRHCSISMPVVDTIFAAPEKWAHWRRLDGGGGQIRQESCPGNKVMAQRPEGSQAAVLEGKGISLFQFHQKRRKNSVS
jgi:hypothetical protein